MLNLLAVDLGASSGRVMHGGFDGHRVQLDEARRFHNGPVYQDASMLWDIHALYQEIKAGILEAMASYGDIQSVAIDSWAVDFGLLDSAGNLLALPRHYRDPRNIASMQHVVQRLGHQRLFERSGIQLQPFNSLYQWYSIGQEAPDWLSAARTLLLIPDLINFFLTGERRAEFTNATTTQFLRHSRGDWDVELLSDLGLPASLLPIIVQPGTVLGPCQDACLLESNGLSSTQVVHTLSHDTAAAVMAVPAERSDFAYISSGTWSLMGTVVEEPVTTEQARQYNFTNEGGLGSYRLLKNVMGMWLIQETQRVLTNRAEPSDIRRLIEEASQAPRFRFFFDVDDERLLAPGDIPSTIRQICHETGQRPPADAGTLVRGILESLAMKYRTILDELTLLTGRSFECIHIVGGGSQNELLSQFTADATGRRTMAGPVEASALGNVLGQLLALGQLSAGSDIRDVVHHSVTQKHYHPHDVDAWEFAFGTYRRMVERQQVRRQT